MSWMRPTPLHGRRCMVSRVPRSRDRPKHIRVLDEVAVTGKTQWIVLAQSHIAGIPDRRG